MVSESPRYDRAMHIGDIITLDVNGIEIKYSPLNYCKTVLNSSSATPDEAQSRRLANVVKEYRLRLIRKGLVDGSIRGQLSFTLPLFGEFVLDQKEFA